MPFSLAFWARLCLSFRRFGLTLSAKTKRFQRSIGRERDQMRQERDAVLQQVAELERLNDEILRGVPDREPRPELEPERDPEPEPEPSPQPARRRAPPATPRGAGAAREVGDARQARLVQLRGVDCPYVLQNTPIIAVSAPFSCTLAGFRFILVY